MYKLVKKKIFKNFDGSISISSDMQKPDRFRHLEIINKTKNDIARGSGLSYVPLSFGVDSTSIEMLSFNRILEFDKINDTIVVEAGAEIGEINRFLIENGYVIAASPGHPKVTIGGAIAVDAHGKNPFKDGTICDSIINIYLYHKDFGFFNINNNQNNDIFKLTCGGFGHTGIIINATLKLKKIDTNTIKQQKLKFNSYEELLEKIDREVFNSDYVYSWHYSNINEHKYNKGLLFIGQYEFENTNVDYKENSNFQLNIKYEFWNKYTIQLANKYYKYLKNNETHTHILNSLYPLSKNNLYFNFFGDKGFIEIQCLIECNKFALFMENIQKIFRKFSITVTLFSIKKYNGKQNSLSMTGEGFIVTIDFKRDTKVNEIEIEIFDLIISLNCQLNLAKTNIVNYNSDKGKLIKNIDNFFNKIKNYDSDIRYRSELTKTLGYY